MEAGHEVDEAEDGFAALDVAGRKSIDVVVTDVNMPKVDGITLLSELRKLTPLEFTPILVLRAETDSWRQEERFPSAVPFMR